MLSKNEEIELQLIDEELETLIKKGVNDENLNSKRNKLLKKKFNNEK
jgi:hypothetical protein